MSASAAGPDFTAATDAAIARVRSNDPTLLDVDLSGRLIGDTLHRLADALRNNTSLRRLHLQGNSIAADDAALVAVAEVLADSRRSALLYLDLSGNEAIGADAGAALLAMCTAHASLRELKLGGTAVPAATVAEIDFATRLNGFPVVLKAMAMRAARDDPSLFAFELEYDDGDPKTFSEETCQIVVDALAGNTNVRTLRMPRCCRGEHSVRVLRAAIAASPHLTSVDLSRNQLGAEAVALIVGALRANDRLALDNIDLSFNELDDEAAMCLVDFLGDTDALRAVHFRGNGRVSDNAAVKLQTAAALNGEPPVLKGVMHRLMQDDDELEVLSLRGGGPDAPPSRGYLTSLGAKTLSAAMANNEIVHTVDLSNNHIAAEGCAALGRLLRSNGSITSVDLRDNPLDDEGVRHLIQGLAHNDNVVACFVDAGKGVSGPLVRAVNDVCRVNVQPLPLKAFYVADDLVGVPRILDLSARAQPLGKLEHLSVDGLMMLREVLRRHRELVDTVVLTGHALGWAGTACVCDNIIEANLPFTTLRLTDCGLDDRCVDRVVQAMTMNYHLRDVVVSGNHQVGARAVIRLESTLQLCQQPAYLKDVIPHLANNVGGITALEFVRAAPAEYCLGDDGCKLLFDALRRNGHVTTIRVVGHEVSNRGVGYLCQALRDNTAVALVDLSGNQIQCEGAADLAGLMEHDESAITALDLSHNAIKDRGALVLLQTLHGGNRAANSLLRLGLDGNPVAPRYIEHLRVQMLALRQPHEFYANFAREDASYVHDVSDDPVEESEALFGVVVRSAAWFIERIEFDGVVDALLGDDACDALCGILARRANRRGQSASAVTAVSLTNHRFGGAGTAHLAAAVSMLANCTSVDLSNNSIGADSAPLLLQMLRSCPKITALNLDGNPIADDPSAAALADRAVVNGKSAVFRAAYDRFRAAPFTDNRLNLKALDMDDEALSLLLTTIVETDVRDDGDDLISRTDMASVTSGDNAASLGRNSVTSGGDASLSLGRNESVVVESFSVTEALPVDTHSVASGAAALDGLRTFDLSDNPQLTEVGVYEACCWLLAAAPRVQHVYFDQLALNANGITHVKALVWASASIVTASLEQLLPVDLGIPLDEYAALLKAQHAEAFETAAASIVTRVEATRRAAKVRRVEDDVQKNQERQRQQHDEAVYDPHTPARAGTARATAELFANEQLVMGDALEQLPQRAPYVRGMYRDRSRQ
jgi:Ran GTPase-activating protein (RanGAP) involved in mRNA processing and transport